MACNSQSSKVGVLEDNLLVERNKNRTFDRGRELERQWVSNLTFSFTLAVDLALSFLAHNGLCCF